MDQIKEVIKRVETKKWKEIIERSIISVLAAYRLTKSDVKIGRRNIRPTNLYVGDLRKVDMKIASEKAKRGKLPAPITVVEYRRKNMIYLGADRAAQFVLMKKNPDCIVIKLPNSLHPGMVCQSNVCLKEQMDRVKYDYENPYQKSR